MSRNTFSNSHALHTIQGGSHLPRKPMQSNNYHSNGGLRRNNDSQNNRTSTNAADDAESATPKMMHLSRSLRRMKRRLLLEAVANPNFQTGSSSASLSSSWMVTPSSSFSSSSFDYGSSRRLRIESNDSLPSLDEEEEDENEV